ncbi:hypothetical protein [Nocardiopsis kunsanensis]|uniref:Asp23/Gls24 family envelope stress response protein n=1 Tax=Nocardiopsis kunsanensis TaxID=141693 RepID=A0A918XBI1_9ACTN|nr:hypothetical protein [Nocardiopsis kunsanensis]GHD20987.1 hypothetical protein GCM10007147_13890 [Nocardiopsis kunsanensis]
MRDDELPESIARRVADAAKGHPDVVDLSVGHFSTLATPAPGGIVRGVAVRPAEIEVGVVVSYGRALLEIAAELRGRLAPLAGGRIVHVSVEDVVVGHSGARSGG